MISKRKEKIFHKIVKEICDELNINYTFLSKDWVLKLTKDNKHKFLSGYKFDLNEHALGLIFDDKFATYEILNSFKIPVIEHYIIYPNNNNNNYSKGCNNFKNLMDLFNKYDKNVVLKVNKGTCGDRVYHIKDESELEKVYNSIHNTTSSLSLCPFYNIVSEFRVIILDGQIKLLYKKIKPKVIGDGKSTIKDLLINFNNEYFSDYNEVNKDVVLNKGEEFEFDWRFNLSKGAISSLEITENDKKEVLKIIKLINDKIKIGFGSVDVIKTTDNKFYVLEINSGVMMENFVKQHKNGFETAKSIYKEAIIKMFNK